MSRKQAEERKKIASRLLYQAKRPVDIISILQKKYGISDRTAKSDIQAARDDFTAGTEISKEFTVENLMILQPALEKAHGLLEADPKVGIESTVKLISLRRTLVKDLERNLNAKQREVEADFSDALQQAIQSIEEE